MRNLKKVLSLTLALVMMLGMMTFAGAAEAKLTAADFKDMDKVANKEAVTLLVDLGVLNGIKAADGTYTFNPAGNIERGAYAKMIYAIMMGSDNADVYKGINTGLKDVKGHWAEGFIGYCVSTKIAAGNGNGTFTPNANITVVAASKMLLTALGYDAKASGYEGDAMWAVNIMRDAQKAGLVNGVNQKSDEKLTRDNAALMMFNALNAKTVVPDYQYDMGIKYLKKYDANATTLGYDTFGLIKVTATVSGVSSDKATLSNVAPSLANSYVNNKLPAGSDIVGKKVAIYVKGTLNTAVSPATLTSVEKLISTSISTSANVTLATVMGTGIENLTNALTSSHKDFIAEVEAAPAAEANAAPTVTYYVNGADTKTNRYGNGTTDAAAGGYDGSSAIKTTVDVGPTVAKAGVIVEFIDTDANGKANIVKITDKSVFALTADAATKTVDGKVQVKVPGAAGRNNLNLLSSFNSANTTKNVFGYEGLKKGDVVLGYTANGNFYFEKATALTGKLTATKGTTDLIIDGKTYKASGLEGSATFANITKQGFNAEVTYHLDNGGFIVAAKAVGEVAKTQYAVLTGWTNKGAYGTDKIEAMLLLPDGTTIIAPIAQVSATEAGTMEDVTATNADTTFGVVDKAVYVPVVYSVDKDSKYNVAKIDGAGDSKAYVLDKAEMVNNKAVFVADIDSDTDGAGHNEALTGNAKTMFLVKDGSKVLTYTGIAKAPSYTAGANGATGVAIVNKDGMTVMVYITGGTNTGTSTSVDRAYILDNTAKTYYPAVTGSHDAYYEYDAIIAGEKTVIKVKAPADGAITANTIYALTLNSDGLVTGVTRSADWATGVEYLDGVVKVAGLYYTYDADSLIYVIDGNVVSTIAPADIAEDADDSVYFVQKSATDDTVIKELYIVKNNLPLPTSLTITVSGGSLAVDAGDNELLTEAGKVTSAAKDNKVIVTAAGLGDTYTAQISITGATATTDGSAAQNGKCEYTLVAGDLNGMITVTVKVVETATGVSQTLTYQIKVVKAA